MKYLAILIILAIICYLNYSIAYKQKYNILIIICVLIIIIGFYFCLVNKSFRTYRFSKFGEHFESTSLKNTKETKMIYYDVCLKSNSYRCHHTKSAEEFLFFKNKKMNKKNEIQIKFEEIFFEEQSNENVIAVKKRIGEEFGIRDVNSFPIVVSYVYGKQNQILSNQDIKLDNLNYMFDRIKTAICNIVCMGAKHKKNMEDGYPTTESNMKKRDQKILKENEFRTINDDSPLIFTI